MAPMPICRKQLVTIGLMISLGAVGFGCPRLRQLLLRPSDEGVTLKSVAVPINVYEQTVTVKGEPDQVMEFIADPSRFELGLLRIGSDEELLIGDWPNELGSGFMVGLSLLGIELNGRMIMIKTDQANYWTVIDNPYLFNVQRWEQTPGGAGSRVKIRMSYELPEKIGPVRISDVIDLQDFSRRTMAELDLGLAQMQEHFDPSLQAKDLVRMGLRGEDSGSLLQVYEAEVWVDASPKEVMDWAARPDNFAAIMQDVIAVDDIYLDKYCSAAPGEVTHAPGKFHWGPLQTKGDLFVVRADREIRMYLMVMDQVAMLKAAFEPESGGARVRAKMFLEVPDAALPGAVDTMLIVAGVPDFLERAMLILKRGLEPEIGEAEN